MENPQTPTDQCENTDTVAGELRPFVEPTLTPAGDVFDVTRRYLFMMMASGTISDGGGDDEF